MDSSDRFGKGSGAMRLPRLSIASLMALVVGFAFNFFLLRKVFIGDGQLGEVIVGVQVMVNVLAFAIYCILYYDGYTRFNKGFVGFGFVAVLACLLCFSIVPVTMDSFMNAVAKPFEAIFDKLIIYYIGNSYRNRNLEIVFLIPFTLILSATIALPQLLFAMLGGYLARRYRVIIQRR